MATQVTRQVSFMDNLFEKKEMQELAAALSTSHALDI